ncbi:MAG: putative DNA binding domain-containing protein [Bifidobacteriaceae bacterium]|jgi:predicted HTH transcriptional regulator|nr:putative DNA binding domain-containing protein [Bifidobacteriaceae bacterium]
MLKKLLNQAEGKTLEFKRDLSSPSGIVKTLIAFANGAGGRLIIGVDDDRSVRGIDEDQHEEERLMNIISTNIAPMLIPRISFATIENKTVMDIIVYPSNSLPHYVSNQGPLNGTYVRLGSTNRKADIDLVHELERQGRGIKFDEEPCLRTELSDLDVDAITRHFGESRKIDEHSLQTLNYITHFQDKFIPTNGGIILFGKNRLSVFPDLFVQCARFKGSDKSRFIDHVEIHDYPLDAVDKVEEFVKKHALTGFKLDGFRRIDDWNVPLKAIRELIINAFVHADYSARGRPIKLAIYDKSIQIESPGILMPGMSVARMKEGESVIRNFVIARAFREAKMFEQWGSGINRVFAECKEYGLPEPIVEEMTDRLRWTIHVDITKSMESAKPITDAKKKTNRKKRLSSDTLSPSELSPESLKILKYARTPRSRRELLEHIGLHNDTRNARRYIQPLFKNGFLMLTIPETPTHIHQKYLTSESGEIMLT